MTMFLQSDKCNVVHEKKWVGGKVFKLSKARNYFNLSAFCII